MNGWGTLSVFEGEGIKGKLLHRSSVNVKALDHGEVWNMFELKVPVVKGKKGEGGRGNVKKQHREKETTTAAAPRLYIYGFAKTSHFCHSSLATLFSIHSAPSTPSSPFSLSFSGRVLSLCVITQGAGKTTPRIM